MKKLFSVCKAALLTLLIMMAVPSGFADELKIMFSAGSMSKSLDGDLARIDRPKLYFDLSTAYKNNFVIYDLALMRATTEQDDSLWALIPSIGVGLPTAISKSIFIDAFVMAGIGPFWYDSKWSFVADFAVGAEVFIPLTGCFLNVTNHFEYLAGFSYWHYRLMVGIGYSFR